MGETKMHKSTRKAKARGGCLFDATAGSRGGYCHFFVLVGGFYFLRVVFFSLFYFLFPC